MTDEHDDAPPSERTARAAIVALSRRLRTVAPKDLPIIDRAVLLAVAGRAHHDTWIAFPPVEWIAREAGTTVNTARRALDRLLASGWLGLESPANFRHSARYKIRTEPEAPSEVTQRHPSQGRARGHAPHPQRSRSAPSEVPERSLRGHAPHPADHRKITEEITERSQEGAHTRDEGQGERPTPKPTVAFGPSETTPKGEETFRLTPPGEEPEKPGKGRKRPAREIPDDWQPNASALELGRKLGFDAARVATEADRMRDWARGDGKIKVDWHATFANWLRTSSEREIARGIVRKPIVPEVPRVAPVPKRIPWEPPPDTRPVRELTAYDLAKLPPTEEELADIAERQAARDRRLAEIRAREAQGLAAE